MGGRGIIGSEAISTVSPRCSQPLDSRRGGGDSEVVVTRSRRCFRRHPIQPKDDMTFSFSHQRRRWSAIIKPAPCQDVQTGYLLRAAPRAEKRDERSRLIQTPVGELPRFGCPIPSPRRLQHVLGWVLDIKIPSKVFDLDYGLQYNFFQSFLALLLDPSTIVQHIAYSPTWLKHSSASIIMQLRKTSIFRT